MRRLITTFAVVALPLALVACGDDATSDSAGADTTAAAAESTAAAETSAAPDTTAASSGGTGEFTEFCGLIQQYMDEKDSLSNIFNSTDPAAAKASMEELQSMYQNLADNAPDEIAADVELISEGAATLAEVLELVDYDIMQVQSNPEALAKAQEMQSNTEFDAAATRLDAWGVEQCGFSS